MRPYEARWANETTDMVQADPFVLFSFSSNSLMSHMGLSRATRDKLRAMRNFGARAQQFINGAAASACQFIWNQASNTVVGAMADFLTWMDSRPGMSTRIP